MFVTEAEMAVSFEKYLRCNIGGTIKREAAGLTGIPDFILCVSLPNEFSMISFELKLRDWKRATIQAFRYRSFSNMSYVVVSDTAIRPALKNIDFFKHYNIGLASFGVDGRLEVHFVPLRSEPFSESLASKARKLMPRRIRKPKTVPCFIGA